MNMAEKLAGQTKSLLTAQQRLRLARRELEHMAIDAVSDGLGEFIVAKLDAAVLSVDRALARLGDLLLQLAAGNTVTREQFDDAMEPVKHLDATKVLH